MAVTLICGPPCAGKTTFALEHTREGDLLVDHDLLAQRFGSPVTHGHGRGFRKLAERQFHLHVADIRSGLVERAWVVRTMPHPARRAAFASLLGGAGVIVLDPGIEVCRRRAMSRPNPTTTLQLINRWYAIAKSGATP